MAPRNNTVSRAQPGIYPTRDKQRREEVDTATPSEQRAQGRGLAAMVDRAAWEKLVEGRAGTRWGRVVDTVSKGIGGREGAKDELLSIHVVRGVQDRSKKERAKPGGRLPTHPGQGMA